VKRARVALVVSCLAFAGCSSPESKKPSPAPAAPATPPEQDPPPVPQARPAAWSDWKDGVVFTFEETTVSKGKEPTTATKTVRWTGRCEPGDANVAVEVEDPVGSKPFKINQPNRPGYPAIQAETETVPPEALPERSVTCVTEESLESCLGTRVCRKKSTHQNHLEFSDDWTEWWAVDCPVPVKTVSHSSGDGRKPWSGPTETTRLLVKIEPKS
jgi:hypothetical protein